MFSPLWLSCVDALRVKYTPLVFYKYLVHAQEYIDKNMFLKLPGISVVFTVDIQFFYEV